MMVQPHLLSGRPPFSLLVIFFFLPPGEFSAKTPVFHLTVLNQWVIWFIDTTDVNRLAFHS
jgi:hypothetical protein